MRNFLQSLTGFEIGRFKYESNYNLNTNDSIRVELSAISDNLGELSFLSMKEQDFIRIVPINNDSIDILEYAEIQENALYWIISVDDDKKELELMRSIFNQILHPLQNLKIHVIDDIIKSNKIEIDDNRLKYLSDLFNFDGFAFAVVDRRNINDSFQLIGRRVFQDIIEEKICDIYWDDRFGYYLAYLKKYNSKNQGFKQVSIISGNISFVEDFEYSSDLVFQSLNSNQRSNSTFIEVWEKYQKVEEELENEEIAASLSIEYSKFEYINDECPEYRFTVNSKLQESDLKKFDNKTSIAVYEGNVETKSKSISIGDFKDYLPQSKTIIVSPP